MDQAGDRLLLVKVLLQQVDSFAMSDLLVLRYRHVPGCESVT